MFGKKAPPPIKSLIAHGTRIDGDVTFSEGLRVDGAVIGQIRAAEGKVSILVVSEVAEVTGCIEADHVIINGRVKGPVVAHGLLELQPKACIEGDVSYKSLEMHQGATISGQLRPLSGESREKPTLLLASNGQ
ncbi:MAG: cell shape determination protein CcmA [Comamonadaceae bacterium]|jgi:cytoskeletal protein CcmA (bactofilin family)|nr:cell shape determination protein CcmA [Comamonadaceae bacterium]